MFLHSFDLLSTIWHLSLLISSPLPTDTLVKLAPVFHQALLGAVLGGKARGAAVRVSAALETVVTLRGFGKELSKAKKKDKNSRITQLEAF